MLQRPKIYSIKVEGIKCTNCAGKIKNALDSLLREDQCKISVNVMQQIVTVSTKSFKDLMPSVLQQLQKFGYPAVGQPLLLEGGPENQRQITIKVAQNSDTERIQALVRQKLLGITNIGRTHIKGQNDVEELQFKLSYNPEIIKGRQIADFFQTFDSRFITINQRVQSFKNGSKAQVKGKSLKITFSLCLFFLIFNMFLPLTGEWYKQLVTFPKQLSLLSFSVILNLILSGYVFKKYTREVVYRAFTSYRDFRSTDMQTLISLGCLSAFALCTLFFIKYGFQLFNGELQHPHEAIMDINDSLTSASIIILVVNIGKHFEHKVKRKITQMTQEIFPESTLFANMRVQAIQLQNRKLKIKGRKYYDCSFLQKGDIICLNSLENQRLLVDVILISGSIRAQQSTTTGCDDILEFQKGDRLQSGASIFPLETKSQNEDCLAMIQNVFEKSMLVEIGTQIKFSQNRSDDEAEGIQAVCKSIASVFVKSVVLLSLLTMLVWAMVIKAGIVHLDQMCSICWIVQRGMGVLVASCPCALGLAVPSVIAIVLNLATKSGILIKNNTVFEKMKITKKISFDKTGTLFTRINQIEDYKILAPNEEQTKLWQIVALIEKEVRHPLAEVLYKEAFSKCKVEGTNFNYILIEGPIVEKEGLVAKIRNKTNSSTESVLIGNKHILTKNNIQVPSFQKSLEQGETELFLAVENQLKLVMRLNTHSNLRPEAVQVIQKIIKEGNEVHILSGDSQESVKKLAIKLNLPLAMLHPEHSSFMKMKWIKDIQQSGKEGVMMIGDGLNDIPCLQQSAIGVSINAKSELNINAADVVVLEQNLYKILALIRLIKRGNLFININLFWAFSYNILIMPIVAGVFYKWDIWVSPVWSSIAMSMSSIIVVGISHLLSFFKFDDSLNNNNRKGNVSKHNLQEINLTASIDPIMKEKRPPKNSKYVQLIESN